MMRVTFVRFVIALALSVFDWLSFQFTQRPDVAPYLTGVEQVVLICLYIGMMLTLAHLWILAFATLRAATRTHKTQHTP